MNIENLFYFLKEKNFMDKDYYLKILNRNILINNNILNFKLAVYNGKFFIPIKVEENKIGNMLGSFSFSKNILLKKKKKIYKKKK